MNRTWSNLVHSFNGLLIEVRREKARTSSFLCGRITATNDGERLIPENGYRTVTDGAGADPALPVSLFALEPEAFCASAGRDDDCVCRLRFLVLLILAPVTEGPPAQVDLGHCLGDDARPEPQRLRAEFIHELGAEHTRGEPWEVLDIGGGGQLAASCEAVRHEAFEKDRAKVRAREIDSCCVPCGARTDDHLSKNQFVNTWSSRQYSEVLRESARSDHAEMQEYSQASFAKELGCFRNPVRVARRPKRTRHVRETILGTATCHQRRTPMQTELRMQRTHNVMTVRTEAFSDTPRSKTHLEWISSDKANSDEAHEDISAAAHRRRTAERYPTVEASPGKRTSTTIPMGGRKATHHFGVHSRALGDGAVDDHRACSVSYGCHFGQVSRKV